MPAVIPAPAASPPAAPAPVQADPVREAVVLLATNAGEVTRINESIAKALANKRVFVTEVVAWTSEGRIKKLITREQ